MYMRNEALEWQGEARGELDAPSDGLDDGLFRTNRYPTLFLRAELAQ